MLLVFLLLPGLTFFAMALVFVVASTVVGAIGLWYVRSDEVRGAFLLAPSVFPHVFGWIMRLQPPRESAAHTSVAARN